MLAQAASLPFKQIIQSLQARKIPSFWGIIESLKNYRERCQAAVILNSLDPAAFARAARAEKAEGDWSEDPLVDACLKAINEVAPLDMDAMSMRFENSEWINELYPAQCGYPVSWDEWDEMTQSTDDWQDGIALYIFVTAIRFGDHMVLINGCEQFGWEFEHEELSLLPEPNFERLYVLLDQHGLSCFKNAIDVCLYSTGNPYFDFNPYDEGIIYDLPAFTLEGIEDLKQAWIESRPISQDLTAAVAKFGSDPALARVLMMLYAESADEPAQRPQTLAELWAGEADEAPVDPFYGPLTGDDEEES